MAFDSFDTFFACTILVAAALIGTAFLGQTMQTKMIDTQDINKNSYLRAIADRIISDPGTPTNWATTNSLPSDFGLAKYPSTTTFELDIDKISRLNSQNNNSLSYFEISNVTKPNNIALGITVSQLLNINVLQISNITVGSNTSFTFVISTTINSKPTSASLRCYLTAENYLNNIIGTTSEKGNTNFTIQISNEKTSDALLIVFARALFDNRITSYVIYNFARSTQELIPSNTVFHLSPLDYNLSFNGSQQDLLAQNAFIFSYSYQQPITSIPNSQYKIPSLIDTSPLVLVVSGHNVTEYLQEWTAYPQIPLEAGANFDGSQRNVFSYLVSVNDVLYKLELSLGDYPH